MAGPAITTRRKPIIHRRLEQGRFGTGTYWVFTLKCGHHVTRPSNPGSDKQRAADCWNCPPEVRGSPNVRARVLGE